MNIAVFVSGNGSNLQALIDAQRNESLGGEIVLVLSNNPKAFALERAKRADIETCILDHTEFSTREEYDQELIKILEDNNITLVVLAGFMRLLSDGFIKKYKNRILNIHPALLPSFKGIRGIEDAYNYGVKLTGVTVHFVDKELDAGPIILQKSVSISEEDTLRSLEEKIHKTEHQLYPKAVSLFTQGKLRITGRKVRILE